MPERTKAVNRIVAEMLGPQASTDMMGHINAAHLDSGEIVSGEDFLDRFVDPVERLWEVAVDGIDWNVVLLAAQTRHLTLDHEDEDDSLGFAVRGICGECLCEALMVGNTFADWEKVPKIRRGGYGDGREYA